MNKKDIAARNAAIAAKRVADVAHMQKLINEVAAKIDALTPPELVRLQAERRKLDDILGAILQGTYAGELPHADNATAKEKP